MQPKPWITTRKNPWISLLGILLLLLFVVGVGWRIGFHDGEKVGETGDQTDVPFYWEFINVDIDLKDNGDMLISETQKYVFPGPNTNERFRWIPLHRVDGIEDVKVSQNGEILSTTTGIDNNQLWIRWSHELNPPRAPRLF